MAPSRRNSNGRSPLVNQQRQITSFFTKTPTPSPSPSPSPILSKSNQKLNPNPISDPNPSSTSTTPSPLNPKSHKPLLVIGASSTPSPSPSYFGKEVVGKRIKVYWPLDNAWYEGVVKSFDNITSKHLVRYDDDEEECVDLSKEKIEWPKDSSTKKLKRLRRGSSPLRKMVIEEDNEVEESLKEEEEHVSDDSEDEDWGKNAALEDAEDDDDEDKDMELEDEDDVAERVKGNPSGMDEPKKRKLGGLQKHVPTKKIKSGMEANKGAFKLSVLEPMNNLEGK